MTRRPAAATWIPLLVLVVLGAVGVCVTDQVPQRPAARLLQAAKALCSALVAGDTDAAAAYLSATARTPFNLARLAQESEHRRGATFDVRRVDPDEGKTVVVWSGSIQDDPRRGEVLLWALQPDGSWKLVL